MKTAFFLPIACQPEDDERIRLAIQSFTPRLLVIDPIQAYLGNDSDLQIAGRARRLMHRLSLWASTYDCAVVLIGHLNKKEGAKGLYRSLGSIDVVAAARSVLQVERDATDADVRIVRQIKNSLGPSNAELRYEIRPETGFRWLNVSAAPVSEHAAEKLCFHTKAEKAAYLIKRYLTAGDMKSVDIYSRLEHEGISRRTAEETRKAMGVRCYRLRKHWNWSLNMEGLSSDGGTDSRPEAKNQRAL